jgi:hypothetical protein
MSKNTTNPLKNIFKITIFSFSLLIISTVLFGVSAQAAEFYPKNQDSSEKIEIASTRENVYAAGKEVVLNQSVAKDIVIAGSNVQINGNVGRSIIVVAQDVTINSDRVAGNARIVAQKVQIKGNFGEEVIIAAKDVTIENSIISGDLVVATENLTIKNSQILGDAKISYSKLDGDLKSQVKGEIQENKDTSNNFGNALLGFLSVQFSVVVFLLVVGYLLFRKKALEINEIRFGSRFGSDILISLGFLFLTLPILVLSLIIQLSPLVGLISIIVYTSFVLSSFFLPIYVANFAKNTFKITNIKISYLIAISYLVIVILSIIPIVNIVSFVVFFVLLLGNFGFLVRKLASTIWNSLSTPADQEEVETELKPKKVKKEEK